MWGDGIHRGGSEMIKKSDVIIINKDTVEDSRNNICADFK